MKGIVKSIIEKPYKDRSFFEVFIELAPDKVKKYSCWQKHASELKAGQEVEYTEEEGKGWIDGEGVSHVNWKMILPGGQKQGFQGGFRGKSPQEIENQLKMMTLAYSKDLVVAFIGKGIIKAVEDGQKWTADTYDILYKKVSHEDNK